MSNPNADGSNSFAVRERAPSVADIEVKMLLSNLNAVSASSDSEAESSELELEFDQRKGSIRRAGSNTRIRPKRSSSQRGPNNLSSVVDAKLVVGSKEWWDRMKEMLQKETEKQMLESEDYSPTTSPHPGDRSSTNSSASSSLSKRGGALGVGTNSSSRTNRKRTTSWLEARDKISKALEDEARRANQQQASFSTPTSPLSSSHPDQETTPPPENQTRSRNNKALISSTTSMAEEDDEFIDDDEEASTTSAGWWDDLKKELDGGEGGENGGSNPSSSLATATTSPPASAYAHNHHDAMGSSSQSTPKQTPLSPQTQTVAVHIEELDDEEDDEEMDDGASAASWWDDLKKDLDTEVTEISAQTTNEQTENEKKESQAHLSSPETPISPNIKDSTAQPATNNKYNTSSSLKGYSGNNSNHHSTSSTTTPTTSHNNNNLLTPPGRKPGTGSANTVSGSSGMTPKLTLSDTTIQIPIQRFKEPKPRSTRPPRGTVNESVKVKYTASGPIPGMSSKESSDNEGFNNIPQQPPTTPSLETPYPTKKGVLRFDNGVYKGDIMVTPDSYSLAHGYGTFTSSNGEMFIGHWKMGKRDGKGIKVWDDGREYIGEWTSNRRTGHGLITWKNGDVYIGEIQFGFQQGYGMLKSNGEKYIGEWNVNERHGYGIMYFKNGDIYSGDWQHNKKHGHGIYRFSDGKSVEGEWSENVFVPAPKKPVEEEIPVASTTSTKHFGDRKLSLKQIRSYRSKKEQKGGSLKDGDEKVSSKERERSKSTASPNNSISPHSSSPAVDKKSSPATIKDKLWKKKSSTQSPREENNSGVATPEENLPSPITSGGETPTDTASPPPETAVPTVVATATVKEKDEKRKRKLWPTFKS